LVALVFISNAPGVAGVPVSFIDFGLTANTHINTGAKNA
jgi:hypothetical protein